MPQILAAVLRALSLLGELLGIVQIIRGFTEKAAQERVPYSIEDYSGEILAAIQNPTTGLAAIHSDLADGIADILAAFDGLCQSGIAPSWWVDPPIAAPTPQEVWEYDGGGLGSMYGYMRAAGILAGSIGSNVAWPLSNNPLFSIGGPTGYEDPPMRWDYTPTPDWADIRADDTLLSWLLRTDSNNLWETSVITGQPWAPASTAPDWTYWLMPNFTDLAFTRLRPPAPGDEPVVRRDLPPTFPGAESVTLGTPVALDEDTTIPGPMQGVNIAITTAPHGLGKFSMGGRTWWYRLGQIAFVDDAGNVEPWQYISWDQALYTPSRMTLADHAIVRLLGGAEGTGTPWSRTE